MVSTTGWLLRRMDGGPEVRRVQVHAAHDLLDGHPAQPGRFGGLGDVAVGGEEEVLDVGAGELLQHPVAGFNIGLHGHGGVLQNQ